MPIQRSDLQILIEHQERERVVCVCVYESSEMNLEQIHHDPLFALGFLSRIHRAMSKRMTPEPAATAAAAADATADAAHARQIQLFSENLLWAN